MKVSTNEKRRTTRGTAIIEFVVGLPLCVLAVCVSLNLMFVLMQVRILDMAARDAARAAATAANRDEALVLARAAASVHNTYGVAPSVGDADVIYKDNSGIAAPSDGPGPFVAITVSSKLCMPFGDPALFGGAQGQIAKRAYTFPLLHLSEHS